MSFFYGQNDRYALLASKRNQKVMKKHMKTKKVQFANAYTILWGSRIVARFMQID